MPITITQERPDAPDAHALIEELEDHLSTLYPVESRHGFPVEKLLREGVIFFVSRDDGQAAGCGGVMVVGSEYAEIKRMYVRPAFSGARAGTADARASGRARAGAEAGRRPPGDGHPPT